MSNSSLSSLVHCDGTKMALIGALVAAVAIGCGSDDPPLPTANDPNFVFGDDECLLGEPYCTNLKQKVDKLANQHPDAQCRAWGAAARLRFETVSGAGFKWHTAAACQTPGRIASVYAWGAFRD